MAKLDTHSRTPTRKQLALTRKEQQQLRWIYIGLGIVVGLIVLVLGYGLLQRFVLEPNSAIAVVNGVKITTREYQTRVQYERFMIDRSMQQLQAQLSTLQQPGNEQLAEMFMGQIQQQAAQLQQERQNVDGQTLETMIQDKVTEAEAAKRGLVVSDDELNENINQLMARLLNGLTAKAATETATARTEASATAALWTPTPTFTPSPTLTVTKAITQPTPTPENTPTPAPTPTPNIIAPDKLGSQYTDWLKTLAAAGVDEASYRQIMRSLLLQDKLQEAMSKEAPTTAEQAHARHIMVKTEDEAKKVIERLKAGEDFAKLAAELSQDTGSKNNGGDLGFVPRQRFVAPIDEAIFTLAIGKVSDPIQTDYGWHVVEVLERDTRALSPADYSANQRLAYNDWLTNARKAATVEDYWSQDKVPADPLAQQPYLPSNGQ